METGGAPPRVTFDDDVQEDLAEEAAAAGDSSGVAKPKRMDTSVSGTDLPKSVRMTVGYSFIIVALVVIIVVQDKSNTNIVGNVVSYLRGGSDWIGPCLEGTMQSPIDVGPFTNTSSNDYLRYMFRAGKNLRVWNTGTSLRIDSNNCNLGELNDTRTQLNHKFLSIEFHCPSEHVINGRQFDCEMHFIFQMEDSANYDDLAFIAILLEKNETGDPFVEQLLINVPTGRGESYLITTPIDASRFLPPLMRQHYKYIGSRTIPECEENVQWYVAANTATISVETHAKLEALWAGNLAFAGGRGNNRKVQDTNNRTITFFSL